MIATDVDDKDFIIKGQDSTSEITALTLDMSEAGNASFNGTVTANAGVIVDNITIDGTEIDLSSGDLTVDVAGDIILDAGGEEVIFKDGSTNVGHVSLSSDNLTIKSLVSDKDIIFQGNDGGSPVTALTLDMSEDGSATFNNDVTVTGRATGTVTTNTNGQMDLEDGNHFNYTPSGTDEIELDNFKAGQSGTIFLDNSGGHTISVDSTILINADQLTAIKTAGKYMLSYFCTVDQPNATLSNSANDNKIIMSVSGALT